MNLTVGELKTELAKYDDSCPVVVSLKGDIPRVETILDDWVEESVTEVAEAVAKNPVQIVSVAHYPPGREMGRRAVVLHAKGYK